MLPGRKSSKTHFRLMWLKWYSLLSSSVSNLLTAWCSISSSRSLPAKRFLFKISDGLFDVARSMQWVFNRSKWYLLANCIVFINSFKGVPLFMDFWRNFWHFSFKKSTWHLSHKGRSLLTLSSEIQINAINELITIACKSEIIHFFHWKFD